MKDFSKRVKDIEVSLIRYMPVLASKVPDTVSLGQGLPSFELPEEIKEKLIEALRTIKDINKYSLEPGLPILKEEVAKYLEKTKNVKINPEKEICITKGAIGGLFCTISSLIEKGDEVILLTPAYEPHIEQVKFAEGKPIFVPLIEKLGWRPNFDAIDSSITKKTKAIIICDPSNPTGGVFEKEDLKKIADLANKFDLFIITDETYDFLTYDEKEHFSLLSFPEVRDRLIACFSFSKKYAMTGFRVGYVVSPENIMNQILKVHDESTICAPTISQYAALFALTSPQNFVQKFKEEFQKRRDLICQRLDQLKDLFEYQKSKGAYYIFPKLKLPIKSKDFSLKLLYKAKVITIPGIAFGPSGEGHIRLSFAGKEKDINEAFNRIEEFWINLKKTFKL
ncbi:MAG: aminotransferase [Candidatus Staskawiczbacteria bacterium CG10_big_fil_rev_8_21_14_0_10_38_10]|uniref:Aminotransferase n=1 Tax=Candidatus Staskawiczbacteria bacterium CG10_big_fil_rev_8_21_14_0_10_38_10 TaxID=1974891 RepID=A0A2H9T1K5_9BACT|nr:MAG: aminotransferase [Candidatus Staskawiczbacteria bacterium CG10_big_fil_rev_8_21_14_0_10_38_10]